MMKRMFLMLVLVVIVAVGFGLWKVHAMKAGMAQMAAGWSPPAVSTIKAETQEWRPKLDSVGSLRAENGADLSSEIAGVVDDLDFDSGTEVQKGTVLVHLRDDDDVARLRALKASEKLAEITLDRDQKQLQAQAVSQATVDNDTATLNSAKAASEQQQAIIDKKTIRAPFAGHLGIRQVDLGQYVNAGTPLVTLQQLDPIYVDFNLPEQYLGQLSANMKVTAHVDAMPDVGFEGEIAAINSKIDEATRNVQVRAIIDNPDHKLLPGMFAHVSVEAGQPATYITLPQTAIVFNTYGNVVYLVQHSTDADPSKPQITVQQSVIITGETRGDQIAVLSGIKEGDEVVTSGQVKLHNGMPITIVNNENQPPNDANPTPHEQ